MEVDLSQESGSKATEKIKVYVTPAQKECVKSILDDKQSVSDLLRTLLKSWVEAQVKNPAKKPDEEPEMWKWPDEGEIQWGNYARARKGRWEPKEDEITD